MAGTTFHSITLQSSSYQLIGNLVNLTGGIEATYTSGTAIDNLPATLNGTTFTVNNAAAVLDVNASLGGLGGMTVAGSGAVSLTGSTSNSYAGLTLVNGGTLLLGKTSSVAIPGDLTVGDGIDPAWVKETGSDQFGPDVIGNREPARAP